MSTTHRHDQGTIDILVDIDSTLYSTETVLSGLMLELYGVEVSPAEMDRWDWWEGKISAEQFWVMIRDHLHADETIRAAVPFDGAVETLCAWKAAGHRIHIVSDRSARTAEATRAWLDAIGVLYDAAELRTKIDKLEYAQAQGITLVIDDKPEMLRRTLEAGLSAATLLLPHNRALAEGDARIVAAPTWPGLRAAIESRIFAA